MPDVDLDSLLSNLPPEQMEIIAQFSEVPFEAVTPLMFAALAGDVDTFRFTLAGLSGNAGVQTREYFRRIRDFLNAEEVSKALQ
jgi:hypothetical protein